MALIAHILYYYMVNNYGKPESLAGESWYVPNVLTVNLSLRKVHRSVIVSLYASLRLQENDSIMLLIRSTS